MLKSILLFMSDMKIEMKLRYVKELRQSSINIISRYSKSSFGYQVKAKRSKMLITTLVIPVH